MGGVRSMSKRAVWRPPNASAAKGGDWTSLSVWTNRGLWRWPPHLSIR